MTDEFNKGLIQPTLIRQLQRILEDYRDDGQILKELIQNAEDAGATVVKFLYDKTEYECREEQLVHPGLKKHMNAVKQGPALYAYNDAVFTEADWRGIRMLQDSVKADDPMKVGRFGLGFKSVFHMTDLPGLMSGNKVGYIDPLEEYFETDVISDSQNPPPSKKKPTSSFAWDLSEELLAKYSDQFSPFIHDLFKSGKKTFEEERFNGTIFRFPLRKTKSEISSNIYKTENINELVHSFDMQAHHLLLFLKHIQRIEFFVKEGKDKEPSLISSVCIDEDVLDNVKQQRTQFNEKVTDVVCKQRVANTGPLTCSFNLKTSFSKQHTEKKNWLVTHYFAGGKLQSNEMRDLQKETNNLPLVGVALPVDEYSDNIEPNGQLFCFLPLPMDQKSPTGLNLHINGYFAVDHNRRNLQLPSADQTRSKISDNTIKWNLCLIGQILPLAILEFLQKAIQHQQSRSNDLSVAQLYSIFPSEDLVKEYWKDIIDPFYSILSENQNMCLHTNADKGKWVAAREAYVLTNIKSSYRETVKKILLERNFFICQPPKSLVIKLQDKTLQVNSKMVNSIIKDNNNYVKSMINTDKQNLIGYMLDNKKPDFLHNLPLFELLDGSFASIRNSKSYPKYFIETGNFSADLLPSGCESRVLKQYPGNAEYMDGLWSIAKRETTDLHFLKIENFPRLLKDMFGGIQQYTPATPPVNASFEWLEHLWEIISRNPKKIRDFEGLPIVPVRENEWFSLDSSRPYIAATWEETLEIGFSDEEKEVLRKIGVIIVENWTSLPSKPTAKEIKNYISLPNAIGVVNSMMKLQQEGKSNLSSLTHAERCTLRNIICKAPEKAILSEHKQFVKILPLIECCKIVGCEQSVWLNVVEVNYGTFVEFPFGMPKDQFIANMTSDDAKYFAKLVGHDHRDDAYILANNILPHLDEYTLPDLEAIMILVLDKFDNYVKKDKRIRDFVRNTKFIMTKHNAVKPSELLDPFDEPIARLFQGLDKFPQGTFNDETYMIKLKSHKLLKKVDSFDFIDLIRYIDEQYSCGMSENIFQQAQSVFVYLNDHPVLINDTIGMAVKNFKWIPVSGCKPRSYPEWMPWYGQKNDLVKRGQAFKIDHINLIGCVKSVVACNVKTTASIENLCGIVSKIDFTNVMTQLQSIVDAVLQIKQTIEREKVESILKDVYNFFSEYGKHDLSMLSAQIPSCIWVGDRFVTAEQVTCNEPEVTAKPHVFSLPDSLRDLWQDFFVKIGVREKISMQDLLHNMKKHHDKCKRTESEVKADLGICLQILTNLKEHPQKLDSNLLIPVQSSFSTLDLQPISVCAYTDMEWLKQGYQGTDFEDETSKLYIIHEDISLATAEALNVPSLMSKYLDVEELNIGFGQRQQLTLSLHQILEGYQDGSAVFTELIQNADDAGATSISFIYDTREFEFTDLFIDPKMKELQGPAIMCYNDAVFSEEDFDNIIQISGATKREKTDTIGRYGLGFNAVYNLTDVPSFISNDSVVIFDPHMEYIGKAVNEPGIRLKVEKHGSKIKQLKDQFQPFQHIFGCELQRKGKLKPFKGTLFRFPLRTHEQAQRSKISSLCYSSKEVKLLFKMLEENASGLLLFTQNIKQVNIMRLTEGTKMTEMGSIRKQILHILKPLTTTTATLKDDQLKTLDFAKAVCKKQDERLNRHGLLIMSVEEQFQKLSITSCKLRYWLLSTIIGKMTHGMNEEFLPVGSVAIELMKNKDKSDACFTVHALEEDEGQLFCFLPLPIKHGLPVHVNGCFAVTSDRKHLSTHDISAKTIKVEAQWNKHLLKEVVSHSYLEALQHVVQDSEMFENPGVNIFRLFPCGLSKEIQGSCNIPFVLQEAFYQQFHLREDLQILPIGYGWTNFSSCVMLGTDMEELPNEIRDIAAVVCQLWYRSNTSEKFVDCSLHNRRGFIEIGMGEDLADKSITMNNFYECIFLPHIQEIEITDDQKYKLLKFALACGNLDDALRKNPCIPATNKLYLKPNQLVDPHGPLQCLYNRENGPFPVFLDDENSSDWKKLSISLQKLGMRFFDLEVIEIIECAETVSRVSRETGMKRSKCLLALIVQKVKEKDDRNMFDLLLSIPFIAKKEKPKHWKIQWGGDIDRNDNSFFLPPCQLFSSDKLYWVGCTEPIAKLESQNFQDERLLRKALGLKNKPEIYHMNNQLEALKQAMVEDVKICHESSFVESKDALYAWLNDQFKDTTMQEELLSEFCEKAFIAVETRNVLLFVKPSECTYHCEELDPYFYALPSPFLHKYKHICEVLQIKQTLDINIYMDILRKIGNLQKIDTTGREMKVLLNAVKHIFEENKFDEVSCNDLYLPTSGGDMIPVNKLYYQHSTWIKPKEGIKILHELIDIKWAEAMGIKPLAESALEGLMADIPYSEEFGQQVDLVSRIRRILTGYPFGIDIFKEFIQNADDAGATEMAFILDQSQYNDDKVFTSSWKELQGPALIVYNDKSFSDSDIEGIQKLGEGSKEHDAITTGKYGVGFNSVYHITDVPSFLTTDTDGVQKLCIFDPLRSYATGVTKPGRMIADVPKAKQLYPDVFACFDKYHINGKEDTVFRFPLRTEKMASTSKISDKIVSPAKILELLNLFKYSLSDCLIFLRNIKAISLESENPKITVERASLTVDDSDMMKQNDFVTAEKFFRENMSSGNSVQSLYVANITTTAKKEPEKWLVVQQIGYKSANQKVNTLLQTKEFSGDVIPKAGIACKLGNNYLPSLSQYDRYNLYCLLPLPIDNFFPMHINAQFALDSENRRTLWNSKSKDEEDLKHMWNKTLMEEVVADAFISAMNFIIHKIPTDSQSYGLIKNHLRSFFSIIPCLMEGNMSPYFHYLEKSVYMKLFASKAAIIPVISRQMIYWKEHDEDYPHNERAYLQWHQLGSETAYLNDLSKKVWDTQPMQPGHKSTEAKSDKDKQEQKKYTSLQYVENILRNCNFPLVDYGKSIYRRFLHHSGKFALASVEAERIMTFFKEYKSNSCSLTQSDIGQSINKTPFIESKALRALLKLCDLSSFSSSLAGMPLLLTKDHKLAEFSSGQTMLVSKHSDIVFKCQHMFADNMFDRLAKKTTLKPYLQHMTCKHLAELLPHHLTEDDFHGKNKQVQINKNDKLMHWLDKVWVFISEKKLSETSEKANVSEIESLDSWCIVPVSLNNQLFLFPPARLGSVIDIGTSTQQIANILQKLQVPQINYDIGAYKHLKYVVDVKVANLSKPSTVLKSIGELVNDNFLHFSRLSQADMDIILQYFSEITLLGDRNCKLILQSLPVFETIWGSNEKLHHHAGKVYTIRSFEKSSVGIRQMQETGNLYLLWKPQFENLYNKLHVSILALDDYYRDHILPIFDKFKGKDRLAHLISIKRYVEDNENNLTAKRIIQKMQTVAILEDSNNMLQCADKFYNPHDSFFKCIEKNFPPKPFDQLEWINFLGKLGLHVQLSSELVVKYAKDIAIKCKTCDDSEFVELEKRSKALMECILTNQMLFSSKADIDNLKNIRFIPRQAVPDEMLSLHDNALSGLKFICLNQSVVSSYTHLLWTQFPVLPDWATTKSDLVATFGVILEPSFSSVIKQLTMICRWQNKCFKEGDYKSHDKLQQLVMEILNYLTKKHGDEDYIGLRNIPFIPVSNGKILAKPSQVAVYIEHELSPYLFRIPTVLIQNSLLLKKAGVSEKASTTQYAEVLKTLSDISDSVGVNDIEPALKAMEGLLLLFHDEECSDADISELSFMTRNKKLMKSTDAVFVDELLWKERIVKLQDKCVAEIGKSWTKPIQKITKAISRMRKEIQPQILSDIVKEQLDETGLHQRIVSPRCHQLVKKLSSDQFEKGILRLMKHDEDPSEDDQPNDDNLLSKLKEISFWEVTDIKTYLVMNGERLEGSELEKQYHIHFDKYGKYEVYFSRKITVVKMLHIEISDMINQIMEEKLSTVRQYIVAILDCPVHEIDSVLNQFKIKQNSLTDNSDHLVPKTGDYIPLEDHDLLCVSFVALREGEFVGYEVCDPLNEFSEDIAEASSSVPAYIYAKVISEIPSESGSAFSCRYKVDIGSNIIEAHTSELYSFIRKDKKSDMQLMVWDGSNDQSEFTTKDKSEIKKEIKKILKDAWNLTDVRLRKKIAKRVCYKWHPDKNPEHVQQSTEIFQYIQQLLNKLEHGLSVSDDESEGNIPSNPRHNREDFTSTFNFERDFNFESYFRTHFNRRSRAYGRFGGHRGNRRRRTPNYGNTGEDYVPGSFHDNDDDGDDDTPGPSSGLNPQPAEAYRWIKQAQYDLKAVLNDIQMDGYSYEWACFKSHQAAEKALKATQFAVHANLHDNEHNLSLLCETVSSTNSDIQGLADKLEDLLGGSSRMRYPNLHDAGATPHDTYDQRTARQAEHMARKILEICTEFVNSKFNE